MCYDRNERSQKAAKRHELYVRDCEDPQRKKRKKENNFADWKNIQTIDLKQSIKIQQQNAAVYLPMLAHNILCCHKTARTPATFIIAHVHSTDHRRQKKMLRSMKA